MAHPGNGDDLSGDLTLLPAGGGPRTAGLLPAQRRGLARSAIPPGRCHETRVVNGSAAGRVGSQRNPPGEGDDLGATGSPDRRWK